ncbi:heavy metal-binding domain-containing protein [Nibribacter koreensis]|uniref:Heavy metal binding domain-containing protein n=1 Tax=Nibribacter koreensis TaxID=1084519 RepID=A0ABP8FRI3_9BACT
MKKTFFAWVLAVAMVSVSACNTTTTTEKETSADVATPTEASTPADSTATSTKQMAYICPMNCKGSASMEPGKCPVCKMNLEKNPAYTAQ